MFREAGYRISAVALDWPKGAPGEAELVETADLTVREQADAVVAKTMAELGQIDALIHLVGVYIPGQRVEDTPDETWNALFDGNLRAAFNMMRAVIPHMRSRKHGRILAIGGSAALHPLATWSAISSVGSGLCTLVQVAAAELLHDGVTVNALHPTTIGTEYVRGKRPGEEEDAWVNPRAIGSLLLWLCSDLGRDVTGALHPDAWPHEASLF